jgi:hypothetical protein
MAQTAVSISIFQIVKIRDMGMFSVFSNMI